MDYQPVVQFDSKSDRILIASRVALFDAAVSGKGTEAKSGDFTKAWRDLPMDGNAALYASPRLLQTFSDLVMQGAQSANTGQQEIAVLEKIRAEMAPFLQHGQAMVLANQPDGILVNANSSFALSGTTTAVATMGVVAGITLPVISKAREKAEAASSMNHVKQTSLALKMYALDNGGKYPAALTNLVPTYLTNIEVLTYMGPESKKRMPLLYRSSLTDSSPSTEIILASPSPTRDRMRIVGMNDGSVTAMTETEFRTRWKQQ